MGASNEVLDLPWLRFHRVLCENATLTSLSDKGLIPASPSTSFSTGTAGNPFFFSPAALSSASPEACCCISTAGDACLFFFPTGTFFKKTRIWSVPFGGSHREEQAGVGDKRKAGGGGQRERDHTGDQERYCLQQSITWNFLIRAGADWSRLDFTSSLEEGRVSLNWGWDGCLVFGVIF